jgi:hypothetical protein
MTPLGVILCGESLVAFSIYEKIRLLRQKYSFFENKKCEK